MNRDLAVSDSEALKKAVAWDTQKRLEFVLPFQDLKPSVFLGRYVCMYIGGSAPYVGGLRHFWQVEENLLLLCLW